MYPDGKVEISIKTLFEALDVLRLDYIYALLFSPWEDELGEDFKSYKWNEKEFVMEHVDESLAAYRALMQESYPQIVGKELPDA